LFELLTGRPPFRAATFELTVAQVLNDEPPRPTELVPSLSGELETICLKCLAKEPEGRYEWAAALADELSRFRRGEPLQAVPLNVFEQDARWARKIGYELFDRLGRRRGAYVYTARKAGLNWTVLLKRCAGKSGSAAQAAMRAEAEVLAGL